MAPSSSETRLVLRAQSGDARAIDALFVSVQAPLFRCLLGILGDRGLAEDALQEVFMKIYRKLGSLQEPAVFRPWAYRIATRHAFRQLHRERRWRAQVRDEQVLASAAAPEAPDWPRSDWVERLPGLIAGVSPASRAVLVLHYMEGLRLAEIAQVLELSLGTVKSRLAYGLASLRRSLGAGDGS